MSDQHTHMTPAQVRSEVAGIIRSASEVMEFLALYEDVYADDLSEEISTALGRIGVRAHVLRKQHIAAHRRDAAFADAVNADLDRLKVSAGPEPQTEREDQTADRHDEWVRDWNSTTEGDDQ